MHTHAIALSTQTITTDLKTGIEKNSWCEMEFPDPDDIMNFNVTLKPDEVLPIYPRHLLLSLCLSTTFHFSINVRESLGTKEARSSMGSWHPS